MPFTQSPKVSPDISQRPQSKTWKCDFDTPGVWIDNSGIWGVWPINVVKNISSIRKLCHKVRTPAKTFCTHGIKIIKNWLKMPNFAGASTLKYDVLSFLLLLTFPPFDAKRCGFLMLSSEDFLLVQAFRGSENGLFLGKCHGPFFCFFFYVSMVGFRGHCSPGKFVKFESLTFLWAFRVLKWVCS